MYGNWNNELKMVFIMSATMLLMAVSAQEVVNGNEVKETSIPSKSVPDASSQHHTVAKRAWQQLQSGWGKRTADDDSREESLEELQRKVMRLYAEQLLSNKVEDDYATEDYDGPIDKRAWKSMSNAWGKRDWSQMRGNGWGKREAGNWNNMRGLWGKRSPGWNKLSSAWGK